MNTHKRFTDCGERGNLQTAPSNLSLQRALQGEVRPRVRLCARARMNDKRPA